MRGARLFKSLYVQVLLAMIVGIGIGHVWPAAGAMLKPLSDAFVALVKMTIAPIVFCTIVSGITSLSNGQAIGRTIVRSLALFYLLTAAALAFGLVVAYVLRPGAGMHIDVHHLDASILAPYAKHAEPRSLVTFALGMIPDTMLGAFATGEVLPVLLLSLLFGFSLNAHPRAARPVLALIDGIAQVVFRVLAMIMRLAPLGAFGAMAFTVGRFGIGSVGSLAKLMASFYVACALFVALVLAPLARLHGFALWRLLRYLREELLIVLATSSTEPVLPRLIVKLEALGCDKGVVGLVLPAGYSFNLDGTAIYLTLAALFIAQACDVPLSAPQVATMLAIMLVTSKGAAGVSGSGLVALVATLAVMPDLPVAGVALLVGIDRFMSEARALTSVISNACAVIFVSSWEGACDRARLAQRLAAAGPASTNGADQDDAVADGGDGDGKTV
ncbi:C4-dicarboxylate transporter DctA [Burkholderia cenocepacia]|uniref:Dicarboxylate/amino acid:cation symporter n=2 Tax=Burkholderia cenocepacia TaxID=95486 RepID=A0AAD0J0I8_9BURK|nr:C4-dicarboxylate transporter DctA [Burkholderia cenocepacia]EAY67039.1 Sodium:dicarboxylate symporter [Burkholderia cenocepacia PC184]AWG30349.1 dicarboxylate/amino acid:cation symporter [Burkholderia cenocepacia]MBR8306563.1 C4-dicarboxylate transporter DctA [Burkholderia cenocepacia]MCA7964628.1 C4-dicarboxylate transporter DctA [Burkholderia cenocepacia]MCF1371175.1 C4-dicarboxylate transporter DctA [Burkholderia cenocepacia]